MPKSSFNIPPDFRQDPQAFHDFVLESFNHLYGLGADTVGKLDQDNVAASVSADTAATADTATTATTSTSSTGGVDIGGANESTAVDIKDAVTKRHDPGTNHKLLIQSTDPSNASTSGVSVTSANATDLATAITLANEIKGDVNTLVTDVNNAITKLNSLMANLRTGKIIA